jgi:diguanylate cyclase (GGDEF)-like protein
MVDSGKRILVVDDEESVRGFLSQVLSDDGHQITSAASGEEALDIFKKDPFPLVIADIRLGAMNGIELLQHIRKINPESQVIIITSHASLETAIAALRAGAYDYLIKPFEDLELVSAVVNRAIEKIRLIVENQVLVEKLRRNNEELEHLNKSLRELAIRDGLTGLYNHRYFQEALAMELARSKRYEKAFSLIFMDVDYFKTYNDTHGHVKGDKVLQTLAKLINNNIRRCDFAARYGGEEFVIILPETEDEGARHYAENIRKKIAEAPISGRETQPSGMITASMGVATFPHNGQESSELIQHADNALYQAKRSGKNCIC